MGPTLAERCYSHDHAGMNDREDQKPRARREGADVLSAEPPSGAVSPWVLLRSASYHPFIYKRMIRAVDPVAKAGDVVHLYDKGGRPFGQALYSPRSQIALRVLTHDPTPIDDDFWRSRLGRAVALRRRLKLDEVTDAYRLVHAEGDGLSGLVVERYADCLVFQVFSIGMYLRWRQFAEMLGGLLGAPTCHERPDWTGDTWRTVVRADERIKKIEGF